MNMNATLQVHPPSPSDLDIYNGLVLDCQEEAFTLAVSMLGEERLACEIVQAVFLRVYTRWKVEDNSIPVCVMVFREVIGSCRQARSPDSIAGAEIIPGWRRLELDEQEALLLVDVLGKTYEQAALVLEKSDHEVAATVALGRYKLMNKTL